MKLPRYVIMTATEMDRGLLIFKIFLKEIASFGHIKNYAGILLIVSQSRNKIFPKPIWGRGFPKKSWRYILELRFLLV